MGIDRLVMFLTDSTSACLLPILNHISFLIFTYWIDLQISRKSFSSLLWSQMSRHFLQRQVNNNHLKRLVKYRILWNSKEMKQDMTPRCCFFFCTQICSTFAPFTVLSPWSHLNIILLIVFSTYISSQKKGSRWFFGKLVSHNFVY